MYHYVRPLSRSRYPKIRGLDLNKFFHQLDYIDANFRVVSVEQVIEAWHGGKRLPEKAAVLTFDDGLIDHYSFVFPALAERGWSGAFFPPARAVVERRLLDVHATHHILASADCSQAVEDFILDFLKSEPQLYSTIQERKRGMDLSSRFDPPATIFVKRLLQREVPSGLREELLGRLIKRFVGVSPSLLANELYVTSDQLRVMERAGMHVGGHGWDHHWLSHLAPEQQEVEIDRTREFLDGLGAGRREWTFAYPYGDYNQDTLKLLRQKQCCLAFTTKVGETHPGNGSSCLELPRLDTNDLPQAGGRLK